MRFPAHILLPISGAVLLALALLASWLWPAPTDTSPGVMPSPVPKQMAMEAPPPPALSPASAPVPRPPKPVARPEPARPVPVAEEPREAVATPTESTPEESSWPAPPRPEVTPVPPEKVDRRSQVMQMRARMVDLAAKGLERMERERDEARARGDQAEFERLDNIARRHRQKVEQMRALQDGLPMGQQDALPDR